MIGTALQNELLMLLPPVLSVGGLIFAVMVDPYINRKHRRLLLLISVLAFTLILQDRLEYYLETVPTGVGMRVLVSVYGFTVRPVIVLLFIAIISRADLPKMLLLPVLLNFCVYMTAFFADWAFGISPDNNFMRGPLGYTCHVVSFLLLVLASWQAIRICMTDRRVEALIPILSTLIIMLATVADGMTYENAYVSFTTIAAVNSCVFLYIWLHLQLVRGHEKAILAEQNVRLMISQIQPHFLYNTLSTIQALCKQDPDKAAGVTKRFALYLRQNLESLETETLIPLSRELDHTRVYAEIEMVRFPNIRIEYDIEDDSFLVPALTVQPLVENAIRHGVRIRQEGLVQVRSRNFKDRHEIIIADNGTGFDPSITEHRDSGHIGIRNVRERLASLCGGTLTIDSAKGRGTTIVISIPNSDGGQT